MNDVVSGCERKLARVFSRSHMRNRRSTKAKLLSNQQELDFENCIFHRQELTVREYISWCEHKSSLARKVAVCYRFVIDKTKLRVPDSLLLKGIKNFQECIVNENGGAHVIVEPDVPGENGPQPIVQNESVVSDLRKHRNRRRRKRIPHRDGRRPHPLGRKRRRERPGKKHLKREPWKQHQDEVGHRDKAIWSYPIHDQSYYYPRLEKGLGNGTALPANQTGRPIASQTTLTSEDLDEDDKKVPATKPPATSAH